MEKSKYVDKQNMFIFSHNLNIPSKGVKFVIYLEVFAYIQVYYTVKCTVFLHCCALRILNAVDTAPTFRLRNMYYPLSKTCFQW